MGGDELMELSYAMALAFVGGAVICVVVCLALVFAKMDLSKLPVGEW